MKRNLYLGIVLVLFSMFVVGAQAFGAPALYDDFSDPYIDNGKWGAREFVREVAGGKLVSKIGNASAGYVRNRTPITDPASINAIECEVTVEATVLDGTDPRASFAKIEGFFYSTAGPEDTTRDVYAAVYIGDRGEGLEAYWEVLEAADVLIANGILIEPGTLVEGTLYSIKIDYNGTNGFAFTVDGESSGSVVGPPRKGDAVILYKGLTTGIDSDGGSGTGYASAVFDNVYINNQTSVYDSFSTAPLNQTRWQALEFVREISGGKLRLNVQANGSRTEASIYPNNQTTAYLEAGVLIETGSSVSAGDRAIARVAGWYYNDSRGPGSGQPYNGNEGDVWVDIRLTLDDSHNLSASCLLLRTDTHDPWGPSTTLFAQDFSTAIAFGIEYTLSIEFTGSTIIFKCNNETHQYDVTTPMYDPSEGQHRQLISRTYAGPGQSGYIKANFDDVYVGAPGSISGQVIDEDGPIEGILVNAFGGPCRKTLLGGAYTDQDGIYTIENVPPSWGLYVETCARCDQLNYIDEWWDDSDGTTNCYVAVPVQVTEGKVTTGINFSLGPVLLEFTQINEDGFGDPENTSPDGRCKFMDQLYVGTVNNSGGELWRYTDGATWEQLLISPGFGNPENTGIETTTGTFNDYFYAGTINFSSGAELWRSSDGLDWHKVFDKGFGDTNNWASWSNGSGYKGSFYVQFANNETGVTIWRSESADGTPGEWEQVGDDKFGDPNNRWAFPYVIDDTLYVTLWNQAAGAQIWKTDNGTDWSLVNGDGFGDRENFMVRLAKFKGQFYASTRNWTGGEVWRSADGEEWERIIDQGFGNPFNVYFHMNFPDLSDDFLYIGTRNEVTGGELWRTFDGVTWSQVACCGFGDVNNARLRPLTIGSDLYVACDNYVTGTEVWKAISNTSAEDDGVPIEPVDDTTGETPVTVTFDEVIEGGTTSLVTLPEGDPEPPGFKLGEPATYYELTTTAEVSGLITVCVYYGDVSYDKEEQLRVFHYENDEWVDVTSSLDMEADIICGEVTSLSAFAIFEFEGAQYCTTLGDDPKPSILDQDIFRFEGTEGEEVSVKIDVDPSGSHIGRRATLILKDKIPGVRFIQRDRSALPNEINATLPADGEYRIIAAEQAKGAPGMRFRGDYCLTMGSSGGASETLEPTN